MMLEKMLEMASMSPLESSDLLRLEASFVEQGVVGIEPPVGRRTGASGDSFGGRCWGPFEPSSPFASSSLIGT